MRLRPTNLNLHLRINEKSKQPSKILIIKAKINFQIANSALTDFTLCYCIVLVLVYSFTAKKCESLLLFIGVAGIA